MMYYHVWFSTKNRKWLLVGWFEEFVKKTLWDVAERHQIRLMECETMVDHVHMPLDVDDPSTLSRAMNLLKGASSRAVSLAAPEYKLDARTSHLWQKRYAAKVVGPEALPTVINYIRT